MSLEDRLGPEIKAAMLAKDSSRLGTLRLLKSAIGYVQIERKVDSLPDSDFIAIVQKEVKKRREAMAQFEKGGRPELAAQEKNEISVLETFLPAPMSEQDLESLVREAIREAGATDLKQMGAVIKAVQAKAAGRADGKTISGMVSRLISRPTS